MPKDTFFSKKGSLQLGGTLHSIETPLIMGILNVTPDSFHSGSRFLEKEALIEKAGNMLEEGAQILDVGGYSSRPGATHITGSEESERVFPAIEALRKAFPKAILSVDTFRASIAEEAVQKGADLVNDISAGELDADMMHQVAKAGVPYIMMHMPGTPQDMQERANYEDVTEHVFRYLSQRMRMAYEIGIHDLILDPGFGFGKTADQNYEMLRSLKDFSQLGVPMMVGLSRKSMAWRKLNITPEEALNSTTVLHTLALQRGADILRVHDVGEAMEAIKLLKFEKNAEHFK